VEREGNKEVQLDVLYDYRTNLGLYPAFQEYFRTSKVPVLAAWGRNDDIFVAPGAEAYGRDVEKFELRWLDSGHFALETNEEQMATWIREFLEKFDVFKK
jgi:pimeloyl-ACP methyl ester carboxylesterase